MKRITKAAASLLLIAMLLCCAISCGEKVDAVGLWETATYRSDKTLGEGTNTVTLAFCMAEQSIIFTIQTDKATLGEALFEHGLVNDPIFFDTCNGIQANWSKDHAYWAFYAGDSTVVAEYGIGDAKATTVGNPVYKIVYTVL